MIYILNILLIYPLAWLKTNPKRSIEIILLIHSSVDYNNNIAQYGGHTPANTCSTLLQYTVEPRFNEVAGDRPNLFVK